MKKSKPIISYNKESKVLVIEMSKEKSVDSDIQGNVVIDYNKKGDAVRVNVYGFNFSAFRDAAKAMKSFSKHANQTELLKPSPEGEGTPNPRIRTLEYVNPMPRKGFAPILIIIIVAIAAGILGYVAVVKHRAAVTQQTTTPPQPPPSASPSAAQNDETADWKTYTNSQYGFEVKHPSDLTFESLDIAGYPKDTVARFRIYDVKYVAPPNAVGQDVRTELREVVFTLYHYSDNWLQTLRKKIGGPKHDESAVNSKIGIKVYEFPTGLVGPYLEALFYNNSYIFDVEAGYPRQKLAKDILSTFKFIEPNSAIDTSDWKTYTNTQYGFYIKFPDLNAYLKTKGGATDDTEPNIISKTPFDYNECAATDTSGTLERGVTRKSTITVEGRRYCLITVTDYDFLFTDYEYIFNKDNEDIAIVFRVDLPGTFMKDGPQSDRGVPTLLNHILATFKALNPESLVANEVNSGNLISKVLDWNYYATTEHGYQVVPGICDSGTPEQNKIWEDYSKRAYSDNDNIKERVLDSSGLRAHYTPNYLHWTTKEFLSIYNCGGDSGDALFAYPNSLLWIDNYNIVKNNLTGDAVSDQKLINTQAKRQADIDLIKKLLQSHQGQTSQGPTLRN